MQLSEQDRELFYKLNPALLTFVNRKQKIVPEIHSLDEFMASSMEEKVDIREALYSNISLLKKFYGENPFNFTEKELGVILSWKHFIKGRFFFYKQYKKYCVVLQQNKDTRPYGVLGLSEPLEDMVPMMPCMVETVLLPFKDRIIFDGFIMNYPIFFGGGIKADLKESYDQAKATYGIIEQLPFNAPAKEDRNAALLRLYLKTEKNMEYYWYEIEELLEKNPSLLPIYHEEYGKLYSKKYRKRLKQLDITGGWFAVLDDVIIASGQNKEEARENAQKILPEKYKDSAVVFQVK